MAENKKQRESAAVRTLRMDLEAAEQGAEKRAGLTIVRSSPRTTADLYWKRPLIDLFAAQAGQTEVPPQYIRWMAFQLISASVADRVFVEIFKDLPLAPNLYTCLLGPSGIGKGLAIREVTKFTRRIPIIGTYEAAVTAKSIVDKLEESTGTLREPDRKPVLDAPYLFLVTPELGQSIGTGRLADEFVKWMTQLYEGNAPVIDRTRMHGERGVEKAVVNWAFGTTREWAVQSVQLDSVVGGFFARCAAVAASYPDVGVWDPKYPKDRAEIIEHLHERVKMLVQLKGRVRMTPDADDAGRVWYAQREKPNDPAMYAVHQRERALLLKIAVDLVLSELREPDPKKLLLQRRHMIQAQRIIREIKPAMQALIAYASTTPETRGIEDLRAMLKEAGVIKHSVLVKMGVRKGIGRFRMDALLGMLTQSGEVVPTKLVGVKARFWKWKKPGAKLDEREGEGEGESDGESAGEGESGGGEEDENA